MTAEIARSADGTRARIKINRTLTGRDLETLISDLAELRANISPPVPLTVPTHHQAAPDRILREWRPTVALELQPSSDIRLWIRNQGLGWMIYDIPQDHACTLRDYLIANTPDADQTPTIVGKKLADRGAAN